MFCNRRSLLPSWAQCGPCVSFCGKLPGAVAAISSRQCGARGGQCGKRVALKAPSSAHWSLWGGGWRLNSNLLGHIHCMWKSPLENAKVVSKYWQRPQQKMFRSRAIFSSLSWSYSKPYMWYLLEEPFSENFKVTSYLQRLSAPHPPIPGQGSATDAPGKAKGNGIASDLWKAKIISPLPPHNTLSAGKSWIINYPPSWTWREHHCSHLLSTTPPSPFLFFKSPFLFFKSSFLKPHWFLLFLFSISTSNISQCQRFVLEGWVLLGPARLLKGQITWLFKQQQI